MQDQAASSQTAHLDDLAISDRGFVFDPYTGLTYSLNASALAILRALKARRDLASIVAALREEFEVQDETDLQRDVIEFFGLLRAQGLVPKDFELP